MRKLEIVLASLVLAACSQPAATDAPVGQAHEAITQECPASTLEGVDVFDGDGTIDWGQVQGSGRAFAFIKATQGNYVTEHTFADNWANAKAAGLVRSAYHFFDGTVDGATQAQYFLNVVGPLEVGDLPPMLDIECPTSSTESDATPCEGSTSTGWVDAATLNQRIHDFLDTVELQTGLKPIVYSYDYWFESAGADSSALTGYPYFVSVPTTQSCFDIGHGNDFTNAAFWQWSVNGPCPGIPGSQHDLDRFVGTMADLQALTLQPPQGTGGAGGAGGSGGASANGGASSATTSSATSSSSHSSTHASTGAGVTSSTGAGHHGDGGSAPASASDSSDGGCCFGGASAEPAPVAIALALLFAARRRRVRIRL